MTMVQNGCNLIMAKKNKKKHRIYSAHMYMLEMVFQFWYGYLFHDF